jgi:hypothetical protein
MCGILQLLFAPRYWCHESIWQCAVATEWHPSISRLYYYYYYLLIYVLTAIEFSLGGSSPYTSTDKTNKNKYT